MFGIIRSLQIKCAKKFEYLRISIKRLNANVMSTISVKLSYYTKYT